jgi:hypothetical protein
MRLPSEVHAEPVNEAFFIIAVLAKSKKIGPFCSEALNAG